MPKYHEMNHLTEQGFKLKLQPGSFWRNLFKLWPYLTGDILNLKLILESKSNSVKYFNYKWSLLKINQETDEEISILENIGSFISSPKGKTIV